jgi:hypothetical protein
MTQPLSEGVSLFESRNVEMLGKFAYFDFHSKPRANWVGRRFLNSCGSRGPSKNT